MRTLFSAHYKLIVGGMTAFIIAFTLDVSYQVFSRYVSFIPRYLWTEEVARFCFTWALFLGAAAAVHDGSHFSIDVLPQGMNRNLQKALQLLVSLLVAVVAAYLVVGGIGFTAGGIGQISTTSGISKAWVYAAIPVSGVSMLIFTVERLFFSRRKAVDIRSRTGAETIGAE